MKKRTRNILLIGTVSLILMLSLVITSIDIPKIANAGSKTRYKVIQCGEGTRVEKALNEMTSKGWKFVQSDMGMVIFKK